MIRLDGVDAAAPVLDGIWSQCGDYGEPVRVEYGAIAEHVRRSIRGFVTRMPSLAVSPL